MAKQETKALSTIIAEHAGTIKKIAKDNMDVEKFIYRAMYLAKTNTDLMKCDPTSVIRCVVLAARLGLPIEPALGRFYCVPFGTVATPIIGYKGYIDMAMRSGKKKSAYSVAVFKGDTFEVVQGTDRKIVHIPDINAPREDKDLIAVYAVVIDKSGDVDFDWMTKADTDAIRNRSKAKSNGPWITDPIPMRKKSVMLRLMRSMPFDVDTSLAVAVEDAIDSGGNAAGIIDAEFVEVGGDIKSLPAEPKQSSAEKLAEKINPGVPSVAVPEDTEIEQELDLDKDPYDGFGGEKS